MSRAGRIAAGGAVYFLVVFAVAFVLGAARTFLIEPLLPKLAATAIEAPFLLAAILWAAAWSPKRAGLVGDRLGLPAVGLLALALQQAADAALGLGLRGMSLAEHYGAFLRPEGWLFAGLLLVYVVAPLAVHGRWARTPKI